MSENIEACAMFVSKTKTLKYEYNGATSNNTKPTVTFEYDNVTSSTFVIPSKVNYEFQGWYLDKDFTRRVTDKNGVYFLGESILFSDADTLYARWEPHEGIVYPVLMLIVGNIDAQFKDKDTEKFYPVKHELTIPEIKTCELITSEVSRTINEWFEGKVYFEFDCFFTVSTIDNRAFSLFYPMEQSPIVERTASLNTPLISEAAPVLKNYRSVLTTIYTCHSSFPENPKPALIHSELASDKYGDFSLDALFYLKDQSKPIPLEDFERNDFVEGYLHEFTHTIEQGIGLDDYHQFRSYYSKDHHEKGDSSKSTKLYLLNQAELNGNLTGIPFTFWEGKLSVSYRYWAQNDELVGTIRNLNEHLDDFTLWIRTNCSGEVPYGSSVTVEAIPYAGYKFVGWSDGVTTPIRTDKNITSRLEVYAIFEKIKY